MSSLIEFKIELSAPSIEQMKKDILEEFLKYMSEIIMRSLPFIKSKIITLIEETLRNSPIWSGLDGGDLQEVLLLPNPTASLYNIERAVIESINILNKPVSVSGSLINGGFQIGILSNSLTDVLSVSETSYTTINGKFVPWLEWLLFYGTGVVINKGKLIQTKKGVIIGRDNNDMVIPSAYSGTPTDNFLTRALLPIEPIIGSLIEEEISRRT